MKKISKILLILTSISLNGCGDNIDKQMEKSFLSSHPNADINAYRFVYDKDKQEKLISSPEFQLTYMMKDSESNTSTYDSNLVYPTIDWNEFKLGYTTDIDSILTDVVKLMDSKQHEAIKSLSKIVGDTELENDYSVDIYNDIEEYLPDFTQEHYAYSNGSSFDLASELSLYTHDYFDIDYDVMRELVLDNWDYNIGAPLDFYGGNAYAKQQLENRDDYVSPFVIFSYQTDDTKDLIYTQLFTKYPEYLKTNVRHDDLVKVLDSTYSYQAGELLSYVPEDVLLNSYYEHAITKEFEFVNYTDIDVLEYYFEQWSIQNSATDVADYTYDLNNDGLSELIILRSNEKQPNSGVYENTISIFEIQSDDVALVAYFDYNDASTSKYINLNEYVEFDVDDNGKPVMYVPFTIDAHFSYDDMVLDLYSIGYDAISMDSDYTLTQAFYQKFQFGCLNSVEYESEWYYFVNKQEMTENEYDRVVIYGIK